MKAIIFMCFSLFLLIGCKSVQIEIPPTEKTVQLKGQNENDIWVKANNWMVGVFNDAESVVQFSDKESGTVVGRFKLATVLQANEYRQGQNAYALIKIQVKDGLSKITITPQPFDFIQGYTTYTEDKLNYDVNALIVSFEEFMKTENVGW